ncbi:hypothetical protein ACJMK2_002846, partial [Sinanodonta woodiana]
NPFKVLAREESSGSLKISHCPEPLKTTPPIPKSDTKEHDEEKKATNVSSA